MLKKIVYLIEAALLHILFGIFRALPATAASNLGGRLGRLIGPQLGAGKRAYRHLEESLGITDKNEQRRIVNNMWENLGRVIAEYPHIETLATKHITIEAGDVIKGIVERQEPAVIFSAHMGNWEIIAPWVFLHYGSKGGVTYRAPNNPYIDDIIKNMRTLQGRTGAWPKERETGRQLMKILKDKGFIGILVDQKYNEGIPANFFGRPAMTNPVFVQLCQKYKCPLVPVRCIREKADGSRFRMTFYPPIKIFADDGSPLPVQDVVESAHRILEGWIAEHPDQWLWLHRRWNSKKLESLAADSLAA